MSGPIRRMALVVAVLFGALIVQLNLIHMWRSSSLATHPQNDRLLEEEHSIERGLILVGDVPIARSVETSGRLRYQREYLAPERYAHITGYYAADSNRTGTPRTGIEASRHSDLTGTSTVAMAENLTALLIGRDDRGNTVRLTIDAAAQEAAEAAMAPYPEGAVVAIDPGTGAVLASYAKPTYDPNQLAVHDQNTVAAARTALNEDTTQPLVDRATREFYPPGSTFKLVVAAAALEEGLEPETSLRNRAAYTPPQTTHEITNYSPGPCSPGGDTITLEEALSFSCNTAFAELGVTLGADAIHDTATALGFNRDIEYELPTVASQFNDDLDDPLLAQSSIGQHEVRWSAMHAALVVAGIVNDGVMLSPHVVSEVLDPASRTLRETRVRAWRNSIGDARAISGRTAEQLQQMMVTVVEEGTGTAAAIEGHEVGGKTGTAQEDGANNTVWFVGFTDNRVAVAVVLPDCTTPDGGTCTGGGQAAPIARAVMNAVLNP